MIRISAFIDTAAWIVVVYWTDKSLWGNSDAHGHAIFRLTDRFSNGKIKYKIVFILES